MGWIPDEVIAALRSSHQLGIFVRVDTDPPLRVWLGVGDIPVGIPSVDSSGAVYMGGGILTGLPTLEALINGQSDSIDFTMSGVDPATAGKLLESIPAVRGCAVHVGITTIDSYFQPMTGIIPIWTGIASHVSEASPVALAMEDITVSLTLTVTGGEASRSSSSRALWSSAQQKAIAHGDRFCDATARLSRGVDPVWPDFSDDP